MSEEPQMPALADPGTGGGPISAEDLARVAQRSLTEIAAGLECPHLIVLAYSTHDSLLRGIRTVGFEMPGLHNLRLALSEFPAADQALRTRQIRPLSGGSNGLPAPLQPYLHGDLVVVPLVMGDRRLAVLVGQMAPGVSIRAPQWQERAEQLATRAALLAEMVRLSSAYQEERRLRQATQAIIAAILEGRPLSEIADIITEQIADRLCEDRVGLYLVDREGRYRPASLRNVSVEYAEGISQLRRQSPFTARALATRLPYYTPDARGDPQVTPQLRALYERENIHGLLIAILHHGDRINGALVVYPEGERGFTPGEMTLFHALSDQATLAISIAQQLEQQRDTATSEERNRLAREIHDTVAQSLAGVVMQVEMAETYLADGDHDSVRTMLQSVRLQSRKALEDTRHAVQGLVPPSLEQFSLAEALGEEARAFGTEMGVEALFIRTGEEQSLTSEQRIALLRIAQEALNNARKHALAHRVRIGLQYGAEAVVLIVEDDGLGFDPAARAVPDTTGGYGLFGMEERARLLGGEVQIDSTAGWGTRIRAALPYRINREATESRPLAGSAPRPAAIAPGRAESISGTHALRVLIADDHAIVRQGLREILEAQGGVTVIGEAENGAQAADRARELLPDVVLMDLQMPEVDGLEGLRRLHSEMPDLPVIVLTTFENEASVSQALSAGARGYLLKDTAPSDLVAAIHAVYRGEAQFSSSITEQLAALASGRGARTATEVHLNEREREVLDLLARGARNREIASELFITVSTVEKHIASLLRKLEVSNRAEAVRAGVERGLVLAAADSPDRERPGTPRGHPALG
jgi:DNA-binding NarL/FixJ family response regulator/signal transduction histidine kinase